MSVYVSRVLKCLCVLALVNVSKKIEVLSPDVENKHRHYALKVFSFRS